MGFLGALRQLLERRTTEQPPAPEEDARLADGVVEILELPGVVGRPNTIDPRWCRFERFEADSREQAARPRRRGPARLRGRVAFFSLFVGRDGTAWSDRELVEAHRALIKAGEWIEREAQRWGAPLNVEVCACDFVTDDPSEEAVEVAFVPEGDGEAPMEADAIAKGLAGASRAAASLGFADIVALVDEVGRCAGPVEGVWLLHPRRAGRSLAILEQDSGLPGVNLAVCYAREANFPEPLAGPPYIDPITIVHEAMHLFGASDKYAVSLREYPRGSVTERDIMTLDQKGLSRMRVDPLTAWELGWTAQLEPAPPAHEKARRDPGRSRRA